MALIVDIEKTLGDFHLKVNFTAEREVMALEAEGDLLTKTVSIADGAARCLRLRQEHDAGMHRRHREAG